jgi:hypothetical protein
MHCQSHHCQRACVQAHWGALRDGTSGAVAENTLARLRGVVSELGSDVENVKSMLNAHEDRWDMIVYVCTHCIYLLATLWSRRLPLF